MPAQRAVTAYQVERLNCAQSILRAFQEDRGIPEEVVTQADALGSGRAPHGRCGALHAALQLVSDETAIDKVCMEFVAMAGSEKCREIRKKRALACTQCIELAATLVAMNCRPEEQGGSTCC